MKLFIGCDHAALDLKQQIVEYLTANGHSVEDVGTHTPERVDYPIFAEKVAAGVLQNQGSLGILVCGTGIGMSLAANKIRGIRAAAVSEPYSARLTRMHNDANIICLGARVVGVEIAKMILDEFITAQYEGGRHAKRVEMITALEQGKSLL